MKQIHFQKGHSGNHVEGGTGVITEAERPIEELQLQSKVGFSGPELKQRQARRVTSGKKKKITQEKPTGL